ncbi:hypothetical protein AK812_SmicGene6808 [Symbiodinium microadriaticum]|uniref:Uncharacterized protein n=1 Tax=Symbiodinium microadriaticum TaxID=2951 RepID=A0A1Q9EQ70_SYMMI|nr:hypothetical protein AK812_SmicGene6808 [Symbiodinium microadriaticum]
MHVTHVGGRKQQQTEDLLGDSLEPTKSGHGLKESKDAHEEHADGYVRALAREVVVPCRTCCQESSQLMFLCGIVFASWHFSRTPESRLQLNVEKWDTRTHMEGINPHLLFYSFLPPLIFSEAMKLNVRLVQKCFAQDVEYWNFSRFNANVTQSVMPVAPIFTQCFFWHARAYFWALEWWHSSQGMLMAMMMVPFAVAAMVTVMSETLSMSKAMVTT